MSLLKAKELYRNILEEILPGVTTVTKEWGENTFPLMFWAWDCGMKGEDFRKKSQKAADAGTLGHLMIQKWLVGEKVSKEILDQFTQQQIELAETAYLQWMEFESQHKVKLLKFDGKPAIEIKLVSNNHGFGGTIDMLMDIDECITITDLKTGSGIYPDHVIQVAGGYTLVADEHTIPWKKVLIANIPKDDNKKLNIKILDRQEDALIIKSAQDIFLSLLNVFNNKMSIKDYLKR